MCENCTRREFLGATAVGVGGVLATASQMGVAVASASAVPRVPRPAKFRIGVIFAGMPGPADRGWNLCEQEIAEIEKRLARIEKKLGNVEFVIGRASNAQQSAALLKKAGEGAPVLAVNLHIGGLLSAIPPVLEGNHPTAVFSVPASGHDWMYPHRWRREGKPVTLFASSDLDEVERAVALLRVIPLMKHSRVLLFNPARGTPPSCSAEQVKNRLGAQLVTVEQSRFDELMEAADRQAVERETNRWLKGAKQVFEPSREDIIKAARVTIALEQLMAEEQADALAVGTCMGWLARGFPCLGFTRLRDCGIPASCEGDMDSLWTMLMFQHAFGIAGFQGNATFDTSRNALWTAHCVGPLKMEGPDGPEAPYLLRSHSEIGDGVVPEILYRVGQKITRAKYINLDTMLISTGTIIEVPDKSVRACRTQIVTEVEDAAMMARNWGGGVLDGDMMTLLHRVVFYGDHVQSIRHLSDLMGFRVIEEA